MPELSVPDRLAYDLAEYEGLLRSLREDGFSFTGFSSLSDDEVVIRHDVDLSPGAALEMARLEASLDVRTTYCFLLTTPVYNLLEVEHVRALAEIDALGHDIGLHFDTHHYWSDRPSADELRTRVRAECDVIGKLIRREVDVVSFHRPPEWVLGVDFAGFENAYGPAYFTEATYRSDSNQKWRREPPFPDGRPDRLQLLVHPGLWGEDGREMDAIVADLAGACHERVDAYLEPLGV